MNRSEPLTKSPLSAQDFYALQTLGDPQISPDDRRVAFVRRAVDRYADAYRSAIWIAPIEQGAPQIFSAGTHRDRAPRWSPDAKYLAFLSDRGGNGTELYIMPTDGGEARQLTRMEREVSSAAWSPDGKWLAFVCWADADERAWEDGDQAPPTDPEERKRWKEERERAREKKKDPRVITRFPYRQGTRYLGDRYPHIYVVAVPSDLAQCDQIKPRRLTEGDRAFGPPAWEPDGSAVWASVNRDSNSMDLGFPSDIVRIPLDKGPLQIVVGAEHAGDHRLPKPSPDGQWVAYLTRAEERYAAQGQNIAILPRTGGEVRVLSAPLDVNVIGYEWAADSQCLYFTCGQWGNVGIYSLSLNGEMHQVVGGDRAVLGFDVGTSALAYAITAPTIPADLYVADVSGEDERRCTAINEDLVSERVLSVPEEVRYTRPDGVQIQGWVMHPPDFDPQKTYPMVVEIHGGPHAMWGNTFWHEFQAIAGQGYVVFFCNPRGSDGYGHAFRDAIHGCWGECDADDILTGVHGLLQRGYIDADRLAVTGGSYGGFMAAWIIGHDQRFAAAVSQRGVYDLIGFYGTTDIPRFLEAEFDVAPWEDAEVLWRYSPLAYVEQIKTPLLILHSDLDYRVPVSDGEQLFAALKRLGREVAFVRYPREGHELSRSGEPGHRVDRIERMIAWFDRHTAVQDSDD
jgi:dipeptidyl aminopeptidase/acylaminoacyl peptidase